MPPRVLAQLRADIACLHVTALLADLQGSDYGVRVCSKMERYSDRYTLTFSSANKWEDRCDAVAGAVLARAGA